MTCFWKVHAQFTSVPATEYSGQVKCSYVYQALFLTYDSKNMLLWFVNGPALCIISQTVPPVSINSEDVSSVPSLLSNRVALGNLLHPVPKQRNYFKELSRKNPFLRMLSHVCPNITGRCYLCRHREVGTRGGGGMLLRTDKCVGIVRVPPVKQNDRSCVTSVLTAHAHLYASRFVGTSDVTKTGIQT